MMETVCEKPQTHTMRLRTEPFLQIKSGKKRVELRLADKKRSSIRIGDSVIFVHTENEAQTLRVRVTALCRYENFDEVRIDFDWSELGFAAGEESLGERMRAYYSDSDVQTYGVLAICIEREN